MHKFWLFSTQKSENISSEMHVYNTAALFNAREDLHNLILTETLERRGHRVILPQRDGFEFGSLSNELAALLPSSAGIEAAVQKIIYLLDVGWFIPHSDVVVGCLDEPVDEGVVCELAVGNALGKYVIGWRSDIRAPFGSISGPLHGAHFFPAYYCNEIVLTRPMHCNMEMEARQDAEKLADAIHEAIERAKPVLKSREVTLYMAKIQQMASLLFEGLDVMNDSIGTKLVSERYASNIDKLDEIGPLIRTV